MEDSNANFSFVPSVSVHPATTTKYLGEMHFIALQDIRTSFATNRTNWDAQHQEHRQSNILMSLNSADLNDFLATLTGKEKSSTTEPDLKKRKIEDGATDLDPKDLEMFGLSNLNKYEHCARALQKAIRTIVEEAPTSKLLRKVAKSKSLDKFARQDVKENQLLHLVCDLKSQYSKGKLKCFDDILNTNFKVEALTDKVHEQTLSDKEDTDETTDNKSKQKTSQSDSKPAKPVSSATLKIGPPPLPKIHNQHLHKRVFSHKSLNANKTYLAEDEIVVSHNERLEFLGDSVLNYVTTLLLYERFPYVKEGFMSTWRSNLVCNKTLAEFSSLYKFNTMLRSRVETSALVTGGQKINADIFEAYIGALAMDRNYELREIIDWLRELMASRLDAAEVAAKKNTPINKDAKTQLYSLIGSALVHPTYKVTAHSTTFNGVFSVECVMGNEVLGVGSAPNLKDAGLRAAMDALSKKSKLDKFVKLRLETDRSISVVKGAPSEKEPPLDVSKSESGSNSTSDFPLIADQSIIPNKFAKNEVYAYFSQNLGVNPEYTSVYQDNEKRYMCELKVKEVTLAIAYDSSKKNAESRAAALILQKKHMLREMMNQII